MGGEPLRASCPFSYAADELMEDEVSPVLEGEKDEVEVPEAWQVVVECEGEREQGELFERLKGEGLKVKLLTL